MMYGRCLSEGAVPLDKSLWQHSRINGEYRKWCDFCSKTAELLPVRYGLEAVVRHTWKRDNKSRPKLSSHRASFHQTHAYSLDSKPIDLQLSADQVSCL